jgi:glutathione peroxidase
MLKKKKGMVNSMKWIIFLTLVIFSFSFLFSFFSKKNSIDISSLSNSIYDYSYVDIDGKEIHFSEYKNKKIMIVNVASKCGYTPQYEGLQKLHEEYGDEIEILGFPANDFLWQEPGKNNDIKNFCSTKYGVTFTIFQKTVVKKNKKQNPIYAWLSHKELNGWNDNNPSWNFCKYLIDENGKLVNFYPSKVKPLSDEILNFINE